MLTEVNMFWLNRMKTHWKIGSLHEMWTCHCKCKPISLR